MKNVLYGIINIVIEIISSVICGIDDLCDFFEITYKQLFISIACLIPVVTFFFMMIVKFG